jgi:hypothetical protein
VDHSSGQPGQKARPHLQNNQRKNGHGSSGKIHLPLTGVSSSDEVLPLPEFLVVMKCYTNANACSFFLNQWDPSLRAKV